MRTILRPEWIIDGSGGAVTTGHVIVVNDTVIADVMAAGDYVPQPGDEIVDLPGHSVCPGLINHHVHLILPGDNTPFTPWIDLESDASLALRAAHNAETSLKSGVTMVRDCGGRHRIVLDVRDAQRIGMVDGARIVSCGWTLTITGGHTRQFGGEVDGDAGIRREVRRVVSQGADFVKVMAAGGGTPGSLAQYPSFSESELSTLVETAHELGRRVTAHCIATASIEYAISAGVDHIEHASFYGVDSMPHFDERVGALLAESGIPVTPTLQVNRDLVDLLPDGPDRSMWQRRQESQRDIVAKLHDAGVPILCGSDAGWRATAFDTFWKELDEIVACGLSPVEAIHSATGATSEALGLAHDVGTIEKGKRADLLATVGDLSKSINPLGQPNFVMSSGRSVVS